MQREALVLALAILAAGCAAPAADVAPESLPVALPSISFADAVALPMVDGIGGGEPNIAALPDGTLFVVAPTGLQGKPNMVEAGAYVWRSQDGGATWEALRSPAFIPPIGGAFCSCDADVVTSPDGWVYVSDWWNGNYMVEASSDGGDSWASAPITTINAAVLVHVDRQWLVAGPDGFLALFYSHYPILGGGPLALVEPLNSGINVVVSHDHGATWGMPKAVLTPTGTEALQIAHARMTPDGALVMPYALVDAQEDFWTDPSKVMLAISTDEGDTWESVEVADVPEGFDNLWAVQADVDAAGGIHVGWAARIDKDVMGAFLASSQDGGATWSEPRLLRGEGLNFLPWVAATGNGTVAMGWYGGDDTGDPEKAKGDWFAYVAVSRDGGEFVVEKVSETPVKTGALCPRGASCGGDRELLDYVSMTFDPMGGLHYAFARSENDVAIPLVASALAQAPLAAVVP